MDWFKALTDVWIPTDNQLTDNQPVEKTSIDSSSEPRNQNTIQISELESRINIQINRHRNDLGLASLMQLSQLDRIALGHSESMRRVDRIGHDGDCERHSQVKRIKLQTGFGENCARGECEEWEFLAEFDLLVPGWIRSPGHKRVLETAAFTHTGVGFAVKKEDSRIYYYATQIFAA